MVDQLEDPKESKGVVKRGVVQVVTQGTLVDESLMREEQTVPLGSIAILDEHHAGIAIVELSTGAFQLFNGSLEECTDELARIGVKEVLYNAPTFGQAPKRIEGPHPDDQCLGDWSPGLALPQSPKQSKRSMKSSM